MPTITSANVANAIVKLVAADALPALVGNLVMGNLVNRDYEPDWRRPATRSTCRFAPTLVANNIAEGGSVQTQNPNLGNAQIVLNTHAEATFQIPDVTKVLAVPDLLKVYMQPAVVAIAEKIESDLLEPVRRFHGESRRSARPARRSPKRLIDAGGDGAVPGEGAGERAEVPGGGCSNTYSQMRQIPRFSEFQTAGDAGLRALVDGTVGKIKDFFVFRSQFVQKTGSAPVNDAQPGVQRRTRSAWWFAGCRSRCRERAPSRSTPSWATSACA